MKPQRRLLEAKREMVFTQPKPLRRESLWSYLTGGLKRMANGEEKPFSNIPWPVFAWLFLVTMGAVYSFASLNATVQAMNSAMILRDNQLVHEREEGDKRNAEERQKLDARISELQAYINQNRVEMARMQKGR